MSAKLDTVKGGGQPTTRERHSTFSVRRACTSDVQPILRCLRLAFEPYRQSYTAEGFSDTVLTAETLERRLAEMIVFVAEDHAGDVIGTVALSDPAASEGHIRGMAVHPGWHGSGIAGALLDAVESELRERNCSQLTLDTTEPLRRAIRFYEKRGFKRSGRVRDFFGMPLFEYVKDL